eukprot:TRINITY_DN8064_c0_g1_i1.p1 TRINITY_DN8064_c0_g1~~TRINITY_DN8064_c0_g1_i1.p1  ORF type:complete len:167 (-),score=35.33 TRINITY_DN8064_c0_g1_i1:4-504(-)
MDTSFFLLFSVILSLIHLGFSSVDFRQPLNVWSLKDSQDDLLYQPDSSSSHFDLRGFQVQAPQQSFISPSSSQFLNFSLFFETRVPETVPSYQGFTQLIIEIFVRFPTIHDPAEVPTSQSLFEFPVPFVYFKNGKYDLSASDFDLYLSCNGWNFQAVQIFDSRTLR